MSKLEADGIDIRTRSVEKVLVPLIAQVSVLVSQGVNGLSSADISDTVRNVLPSLELSICKFTSIGHEMGNSNVAIRDDMVESCDNTNKACSIIVAILNSDENGNNVQGKSLPEAARMLLSAITKILVLADKTATLKMVESANKVDERLRELENVTNFTEFVNAFSQFGGDMVELAYISGERQNDLKNDLQRAEVCSARSLLEKSTMMLLTTCKTCLRHPESPIATGNRNAVFKSMREAMRILRTVVLENQCPAESFCGGLYIDMNKLTRKIADYSSTTSNRDRIDQLLDRTTKLDDSLNDVIQIELIDQSVKATVKDLTGQLDEHRQTLKDVSMKETTSKADEAMISTALQQIRSICEKISTELTNETQEHVDTLLSSRNYQNILNSLKKASLSGVVQHVEDTALILEEELQKILEVTKLTKNTASDRASIITATRLEENLLKLLPQVVDAGKMLAAHPSSKITQENLEVFIDVWYTQSDELMGLLGLICQNDADSPDWLSIYIPMGSKLNP